MATGLGAKGGWKTAALLRAMKVMGTDVTVINVSTGVRLECRGPAPEIAEKPINLLDKKNCQ
jgi:hypothetical protein